MAELPERSLELFGEVMPLCSRCYGIIGGHIPLAVGTAFASKYRGDGRIAIVFFGEGSVSIGDFHEAMSLAAQIGRAHV